MGESIIEIGKPDKLGIRGRLICGLYGLLAASVGIPLGIGIGMFKDSIFTKDIFLLLKSLIPLFLTVLILNIYPLFIGETYLVKLLETKLVLMARMQIHIYLKSRSFQEYKAVFLHCSIMPTM